MRRRDRRPAPGLLRKAAARLLRERLRATAGAVPQALRRRLAKSPRRPCAAMALVRNPRPLRRRAGQTGTAFPRVGAEYPPELRRAAASRGGVRLASRAAQPRSTVSARERTPSRTSDRLS